MIIQKEKKRREKTIDLKIHEIMKRYIKKKIEKKYETLERNNRTV